MVKKDKVKHSPEVVELKNQVARALADYDNLRKRVEAEKEEWVKYSAQRVILKMIGILDILEVAQKNLNDQGLGIAINEFKKVLDGEGIEEINPKLSDKFDADLHEAVESVEGEPREHVAELVTTGWKFKEGKVIRYAKVKVFGIQKE